MLATISTWWNATAGISDSDRKFEATRKKLESMGENPDDEEPDYEGAIASIESVLKPTGVRWFVSGDLLLKRHNVDLEPEELEICIAPDDYERAKLEFLIIRDFCMQNFRKPLSPFGQHYAKCDSYKIIDSRTRFWLVPGDHYGLTSEDFKEPGIFKNYDAWHGASVPYMRLRDFLTGLGRAIQEKDERQLHFQKISNALVEANRKS